jgi:UDPglucose 6-dehydrogenase
MRVVMVGTGYVGLVSGVCFSDFGHEVVCVDTNAAKIEMLREGKSPIYEPGLDALIVKNQAAGRITFTTSLAEALQGADVVFIAVGTPTRRGDGHADLTYVYAATRDIARAVTAPCVVVVKSTVPVGTNAEVARILREERPDLDLPVASNPEFLREGAAIEDFMRPDRVVVGADSDRAREAMRTLYRPLSLRETPVMFMAPASAELTKYAANAFLATKITFINEMADLCEKVGANVQDVSRGIGMDGRIGSKFLHAGPGYGGSCFPKDTLALLKTAEDYDSPTRIVEAVVKVNDSRKRAMGRKVVDALGGMEAARGKKAALLGLTFKPNTDDMRDSPAIAVAQTLMDAGVSVAAYDPEGMEQARPLLPEVTMCDNAYAAIEGADVVVIVTEWDAFRALDLRRVKELAKAPVMVDLRNVYKPEDMRAAGFTYVSVGRA